MGRKRRSFSAEFKAEAVSLCRVGDRSIKQVAKDLAHARGPRRVRQRLARGRGGRGAVVRGVRGGDRAED
jgi:transposase-like protein